MTPTGSGIGGDGLKVSEASEPFFLKVTSATGPAARAGILAGDQIDVHSSQRLVMGSSPRNTFEHVTVIRSGRALQITIAPEVPVLNWNELARYLADAWILVFSTLIAWRGKRWPGSTPLALILSVGALTDALIRSVWPSWQITLVAHALGGLPWTFALLAAFFAEFGHPLSKARLLWTRIAYATCMLSGLAIVAHFLAYVLIWVPMNVQTQEFQIFELAITSPALPTIICGILAAQAAGASEGQRIGWVTASYGFYWAAWILAGQAGPLVGGEDATWVWRTLNVTHIFVPLGLTYAALQRRLFDVGFIINRAAVFTVVSTIVIGSFVLLEWALGKWFEDVSHATSIMLNAALALMLGLSMRLLHHRVDGFVDSVFFRKRNENERALRRFAREVSLMTDRTVMLERTKTVILEHSEISAVDITMIEALDLNDAAVLAMRTWHEPAELARYRTSIVGEYAFPLEVHGNLSGALVCGQKRNEEAYAPDEIDAIKELSHGVGLALWTLDSAGNRNNELANIYCELRAIRGMLSSPKSA
ncbi:MAG TPA: hypothetical protein VGG89_12530 [Candidatus Baltobacteraceae bacterium]